MTTRKANIKPAKISVDDLLTLIRKADAAGYPCYQSTAIACTDKRTVARLVDSGVLTYERLHYGIVLHVAV